MKRPARIVPSDPAAEVVFLCDRLNQMLQSGRIAIDIKTSAVEAATMLFISGPEGAMGSDVLILRAIAPAWLFREELERVGLWVR